MNKWNMAEEIGRLQNLLGEEITLAIHRDAKSAIGLQKLEKAMSLALFALTAIVIDGDAESRVLALDAIKRIEELGFGGNG